MISVPRGTTAEIVVSLKNENGSEYLIGESDELIFGVKTNVNSNTYLISKIVTSGSYRADMGGYVVGLAPTDTESLAFGNYVYDVGLKESDGSFYIVCPCDTFNIAEVVTEKYAVDTSAPSETPADTSKLQVQIDVLAQKCDTNTSDITSLKSKCNEIEQDVDTVAGMCNINSDNINEISAKNTENANGIIALDERCDDIESDLDELNQKFSGNADILEELSGKLAENTSDIAELTGKCNANSIGIEELTGKCNVNTDSIAGLTEKCDDNADEISRLVESTGANTESLEELASSVDKFVNPNIRWCAMGDSITEGYVSYMNGTAGTYRISPTEAWVYKMAQHKNWTVTNKGIGGTGYMHHHTNKTDAAWNVAATVDFTQFDIVTLMYGINDWGYNQFYLGTLDDEYDTPTTLIGGIRKTIETIIASNPLCKIVVITPLNRMGSYMTDSDGNPVYLKEEDNWALGLAKTRAGSLEDVFNGIKSVCEYYGIEMIDMTHSSIVNRKNLPTCLVDNVHPTEATHTVMAKELSSKIMFG